MLPDQALVAQGLGDTLWVMWGPLTHSPIREPPVPRAACVHRARIDLNPVGHHEGRVEAHAELAYDLAASLCLALQCIQKGLRGEAGQKGVGRRWTGFEPGVSQSLAVGKVPTPAGPSSK